MTDIEKEQFAFDLLNDLQDNYGVIDPNGDMARCIQEATGETLDKAISYLQKTMLEAMRVRASYPLIS